jgi:hypothetical protein
MNLSDLSVAGYALYHGDGFSAAAVGQPLKASAPEAAGEDPDPSINGVWWTLDRNGCIETGPTLDDAQAAWASAMEHALIDCGQ